MSKRLFLEFNKRDPITNQGKFEKGDGDMMMRKTIKNFGPEDIDSHVKKVNIDNTDLLKQLFQEELKKIYGRKYPERSSEPSMYDILSGGLEVPVENDYIKGCFTRGDIPVAKKRIEEGGEFFKSLLERVKSSKLTEKVKKDVIYRINKAESQWVSEAQDNYRGFKFDKILKQFIFDWFENPERNKGKEPIKPEEWMNTRYRMDYWNNSQPNEGVHVAADDEQIEKASNKENANINTVSRGKQKPTILNDTDEIKLEDVKSRQSRKKYDSKQKDKLKRPATSSLTRKEIVLKRSNTANRQERINELHKWARWLPDSAYQSYFGKPAFHAYGKNNTKPTVGGVVYGQYMLSHNVNPEHGDNNPKYQQVYNSAMNFGFRNGDRVPVLSRKGHENLEITPSVLKEMMQRNPIMPPKFENPDPADEYTDGSDNEEELTKIKTNAAKGNKLNPNKILKNKNQTKNLDNSFVEIHDNKINNTELEENNLDNSKQAIDRNSFKVGSPIPNITSSNPTPEPGTEEYKRMLEKFIRTPDNVKMVSQEGADMQNMFPFCYVHNSYGQQLPTHELNPRNYKYLPSKYVRRIPSAGRKTNVSESLYDIILPDF